AARSTGCAARSTARTRSPTEARDSTRIAPAPSRGADRAALRPTCVAARRAGTDRVRLHDATLVQGESGANGRAHGRQGRDRQRACMRAAAMRQPALFHVGLGATKALENHGPLPLSVHGRGIEIALWRAPYDPTWLRVRNPRSRALVVRRAQQGTQGGLRGAAARAP